MVARTKIYKGESPLSELQQTFKTEIKGMLKDAAVKMKCSIEQLKYRFDNLGRVEVQKMTVEEIIENQNKDKERERIASIYKRLDNG